MVQSTASRKNALHDLGYKIFLDRYAQKDMKRTTLAVGDTVIVVVNSQTGQREVGKITGLALPEVNIQLLDGAEVVRDIEHVDKPIETEPEQMMDRVAAGIAAVEPNKKLQKEWTEKFRWLLDEWKFVPGGRILTGAGTDQELTFYNCYVIPSPKDSRHGIIETLRQMTEIMSRGGGVGINLSTLRPRHAYVKGVNGRSSGSVSWGALYSFVTGLIEQGGCFGPHERIATDKGLIPAVELVDRIDAGETFYAHTHQGLRPITARFRNGIKPLYEMTTTHGSRVQITEDHKVAVLMDGKITTMPLKYLRGGDEVLLLLGQGVDGDDTPLQPLDYPRSKMSTTLNESVTLPQTLDETLAYVIGYMHGDGYVQWGKKVNWSAPKAVKMATADAHPAIRQRLIDGVRSTFGVEPSLENGDGAVQSISIYSRLVVEWLIHNGLLKAHARDIRVPELIFRSPSAVQMAFVAGYFDADGCNRGKKGGYGIDSISRDMLADVQQLLLLNGIVSRISASERAEANWQTIYRLTVTGCTFKTRFAERVPSLKVSTESNGCRDMNHTYPAAVWNALGARAKYRQRIYDGVSSRISANQLTKISERLLADDQIETAERIQDVLNVMPTRIESIRPLGESEVYDFEVADVHLLSGGGVYTSNSRRGALMLILNDWHPDVFGFIDSKREAGNITNANISVGISDKLMEAVKADADWDLMFPDTGEPGYDEEWTGDIDAWMAAGRRVIHYRTIKARDLWNAIIESAWASAEPGVWFRERSNKMANSWYFNPLISTNPCVTGDTRIYTDQGLVKARELFDGETAIQAVIDGRFGVESATTPASRVFRTGRKPVYRLRTKEGYTLRATADHRIMTPAGWVELGDLQAGDRIHIANRKGGFGQQGSLELGRTLGWLVGDGTIKADRAVLSFFGAEKHELAPVFAGHVDQLVAPLTARANRTYTVGTVEVAGRDEVRVQSARLRTLAEAYGLTERKHQVPEVVFQGTEDMQRGFLQALFSADGSVQGSTQKGVSVRLASSQRDLLGQVQQLLLNFGIASRVYDERRAEAWRSLPDGDGGLKSYRCQAQHELVISKASLTRFADEIGFMLTAKQERLAALFDSYTRQLNRESFTATVAGIEPDGVEEVFDLTEPLTHSFVANGVVVHNCGEQPLGAFSVCNLGAINLGRFYDAEKHDVAWDDLADTVRYATRFLDNVIDSTPYFFDENARVQGMERRVGLGTMGVAELMIYLGIRYGSEESEAFIDKLYKFICLHAYETSVDIAKQKGPFPAFEADPFLESGFIQQLPEDLRERIRQHGIRNVTLLTQAPTGTTGTMVNTSTGIEPFYSWKYYRKSRLGLHEEQVGIVREWFEANPDATELPDYFVTAMDLSPREHVQVQAAFQKWIDSAISKTCNVPNSYTVEQTRELYEYMYELGCKGGTIYRDGSRDEQVLMLKEKEKEKEAKKEAAPPKKTETVERVATPHRVYPRPAKLQGVTVNCDTPFGRAYVTMNSDEHGYPFELFITAPGKAGSDLQADAEGLGRMISLSLRTTDPHNRLEMLKLIIDQLRDIGGSRSIGFGERRVTSLPDSVARALEEHYFPRHQAQQLNLPIDTPAASPAVPPAAEPPPAEPVSAPAASNNHYTSNGMISGADMCPSCANISLIRAEGCRKCLVCGHSEC